MTTAEQVRARVQKADEARIESRAQRAATVAEIHGRRAAVLAELARLDAELDTSVREAFAVMTLDELVEFAGVPRADVRGKALVSATGVKARSPKPRGRPATKAAAPAGGKAPVEPPA
jgi:uncharacterized small protein (DUF1192 family)